MGAKIIASLLGAGVLAVSGQAAAYCRTTNTLDEGPDTCPAGVPIYWPTPCVGYEVSAAGTDQTTYPVAASLVAKAMGAWSTILCGGNAFPSLEITDVGPAAEVKVGYFPGEVNHNQIVFRDDGWEHDDPLARTTVTFEHATGEIRGADIEFNTTQNTFVYGNGQGIDFLAVATHEAGHFMGFEHSPEMGSVMQMAFVPSTPGPRTLISDDEAGMCAVYPPSGQRLTATGLVPATACIEAPLGLTCPGTTTAQCAFAAPEPGGVAPWGIAVLSAAALWAHRRRERLVRRS